MNNLSAALETRSMKYADLARALGVDRSTVTRWAQNRVPPDRLVEIERLTGIGRHELRPDLYAPVEPAK